MGDSFTTRCGFFSTGRTANTASEALLDRVRNMSIGFATTCTQANRIWIVQIGRHDTVRRIHKEFDRPDNAVESKPATHAPTCAQNRRSKQHVRADYAIEHVVLASADADEQHDEPSHVQSPVVLTRPNAGRALAAQRRD